ncbi:hypothetical protein [Burkholderia sp. JKS000303]|uniref:hypothetical protein n=1 Tax=Burkholderia sp. JKS000303 TaxID=1938747 RepID=UPI000C016FA3|nr:hypothetical protein [Burkholderia sp. JKS000303]PFH12727.1 hypothetical protein BX604_7538 [Burkholderia sp. JKS000303]
MTTEATLTLSADQQAVAQKKITDLHHAVGTIYSIIKDGRELDAELATNCVKVAEFNLADLCKALGVETFSAAEREQRYAELRKANLRIRDLEAQIGATLSPEAAQHAIKNIAERLNNWWRHEGFGYVHELNFGMYGVCRGEFSCSLRGTPWLLDSDTPETDKKTKATWIEGMRERGFELVMPLRRQAQAARRPASFASTSGSSALASSRPRRPRAPAGLRGSARPAPTCFWARRR